MKRLNWRYSMISKLKPIHPALGDYEKFSEIFYSVIDPSDLKLKTITLGTALYLKERKLSKIVEYNGENIDLQEGQAQESLDYIRQLNVSSDYLIYPASRTFFFKEYFSRYSPFLAQTLYDCMVELDLVKGVGAGKGYATLVKIPVSELTEDFYQSFIKNYIPDIIPNAILDLSLSKKPPKLNSAVNYAALLHHEIFYYQDLVNQLHEIILQKDQIIAKSEHDNYINSQLTWR
jgi:hypothetical protein